MHSLGDILSSKARTEIIEVLSRTQTKVGIRRIAWMCDLHPRSVEIALKSLVDEKLVLKIPQKRGFAYIWNEDNPETSRLRQLFVVDEHQRLNRRTTQLTSDGAHLCAFLDDGFSLFQQATLS